MTPSINSLIKSNLESNPIEDLIASMDIETTIDLEESIEALMEDKTSPLKMDNLPLNISFSTMASHPIIEHGYKDPNNSHHLINS